MVFFSSVVVHVLPSGPLWKLSATLVQTQRERGPITQRRGLRRLRPALFHLSSEAQTKQTTRQPPEIRAC